jgi:hypothetical protein
MNHVNIEIYCLILVAWEKPRTKDLVFCGQEYASAPCVAFPLPFFYGPSQRHDMLWDIMLLSWWASRGEHHKFRLGHLSIFHLGSPQASQESPGFTMVCVGSSLAVFQFGDLWLAEVKPVSVGYIIVSIAASFFLCYFLMFVLFVYVSCMLVNCYVILLFVYLGFASGFHLDSGLVCSSLTGRKLWSLFPYPEKQN